MPYRPVAVLSALILVSCTAGKEAVQIGFDARFDGAGIRCDGDAAVRLSDLRFYVHDVELLDEAGRGVRVELDEGPWQQPGLAMVDLEDGLADCSNGTAATRAAVTGRVPPGAWSGLRFVVGVPFDRNHGDPLLAVAPLGDAAMHWHWRSGYKFLRAGLRTADDGFWLHLGSTGCEGTVGDITGCSSPNRVRVELEGFDPDRDVVVVDLARLADGTDLADGAATDCSSGPADSACGPPFAALGLDHRSGREAGLQTVFRAAPKR